MVEDDRPGVGELGRRLSQVEHAVELRMDKLENAIQQVNLSISAQLREIDRIQAQRHQENIISQQAVVIKLQETFQMEIKELRTKADRNSERIVKLETTQKAYAIAVGAGVSIFVTVVGNVVIYLLGLFHHG